MIKKIEQVEQNLKITFINVRKDINFLKDQDKELRQQLHQQLRLINNLLTMIIQEKATRSPSEKDTRSDNNKPKAIEKKAIDYIDIQQMKRTIAHHLNDRHRTIYIRDEIMQRFNCGTTCFYKYLKEVRGELIRVAPRSEGI